MVYGWWKRKQIPLAGGGLWFFLMLFFAALSLGPVLHVWGKPVPFSRGLLPYSWLERVLPTLRVGGVPVRMAIMMTLSAALLCAGALAHLLRGPAWARLLATLLLVVTLVEYLPKAIPTTPVITPGYVKFLSDLSGDEGVLDAASLPMDELGNQAEFSDEEARAWVMEKARSASILLNQTFHKKPAAFGFVARLPTSVCAGDTQIIQLLKTQRFDFLWRQYGLRYLSMRSIPPNLRYASNGQLIYQGNEVSVFDLARPNSFIQEVSFPLQPIFVNQMTWKGGVGKGMGNNPYAVFHLDKARYIHAVRVEYSFENATDSPADFQVYWRRSDRHDFVAEERNVILRLPRGPGVLTQVIPIQDTIDEVRIDPDHQPCLFQLTSLTGVVEVADALDGPQRDLQGELDAADATVISGWAWDPHRPNSPMRVDLYDGNTLLATVPADVFRPDLLREGKGNGIHSFKFPTPAALKDGQAHRIGARVSGTNRELGGSPKEVTLPRK
jgi:hypothetical protein